MKCEECKLIKQTNLGWTCQMRDPAYPEGDACDVGLKLQADEQMRASVAAGGRARARDEWNTAKDRAD